MIPKRLQARAFRDEFISQLKNNFRTRKPNYTENVLPSRSIDFRHYVNRILTENRISFHHSRIISGKNRTRPMDPGQLGKTRNFPPTYQHSSLIVTPELRRNNAKLGSYIIVSVSTLRLTNPERMPGNIRWAGSPPARAICSDTSANT